MKKLSLLLLVLLLTLSLTVSCTLTDNSGNNGTNEDVPPDAPQYAYTAFTPAEKALFTEVIGETIPFLANNEYYVDVKGKSYKSALEAASECDVDACLNGRIGNFCAMKHIFIIVCIDKRDT